MLSKLIFMFSLILISNFCFSQSSSDDDEKLDFSNTTGNFWDNKGLQFANTKGYNQNKVEGSALLYDTYQNGYVVSSEGIASDMIKVNYESYQKSLHLLFDNREFSLALSRIDSLILLDGKEEVRYVSLYNSEKEEGLYKVLVDDGKFSLYELTYAKIKKPQYNPILETGNKYHELHKKEDLYMMEDGILKKLPSNCKKIRRDLFLSDIFRKKVADEKKKLKSQEDFTEFFKKLNSEVD